MIKCSLCLDTGAVDDGELTHSEGGILYGQPIKCVKDCPDCSPVKLRVNPACAQIRYRRPEVGCFDFGPWHHLPVHRFVATRPWYIDNSGWECETRLLYEAQTMSATVADFYEAFRYSEIVTDDQASSLAEIAASLNGIKK